jgi:hypothetical protein
VVCSIIVQPSIPVTGDRGQSRKTKWAYPSTERIIATGSFLPTRKARIPGSLSLSSGFATLSPPSPWSPRAATATGSGQTVTDQSVQFIARSLSTSSHAVCNAVSRCRSFAAWSVEWK